MRIDRSQTDEQIYFREGFGIEYLVNKALIKDIAS